MIRVDAYYINTLAVLRNAELVGRKNHRFSNLVFEVYEFLVYYLPCIAVVMPLKIRNVLKENILRPVIGCDSADVIEKITSIFFIIESLLFASLAKWLARETCAENFMCGNIFRSPSSNVSLNVCSREINGV